MRVDVIMLLMSLTVSVVIPAYNESKDIVKCLDSLMHQTIAPNEIIVVNNNSTDDTVKLTKTYSNVKIINETKKGITYARTTGFNAAKSDIIARLDADTIAAPNWVEAIKNDFLHDKKLCGLKGRTAMRELSPNSRFWFSSIGYACRKIGDFNVGETPLMSGCNMAIRRSIWVKVAEYVHLGDKEINEDVDLSLFILKAGKIDYCYDMLVKTRLIESFFNVPKLIRYAKTNKSTVKKHEIFEEKHINLKEEVIEKY